MGERAFLETGAAVAAVFLTVRFFFSRSFFLACAARRFIFNELLRSRLPMVGVVSSERRRPPLPKNGLLRKRQHDPRAKKIGA